MTVRAEEIRIVVSTSDLIRVLWEGGSAATEWPGLGIEGESWEWGIYKIDNSGLGGGRSSRVEIVLRRVEALEEMQR